VEEARAKDAWGAGQRRRGVQGIGAQGGRRQWRLGVLAVGGVGSCERMRQRLEEIRREGRKKKIK